MLAIARKDALSRLPESIQNDIENATVHYVPGDRHRATVFWKDGGSSVRNRDGGRKIRWFSRDMNGDGNNYPEATPEHFEHCEMVIKRNPRPTIEKRSDKKKRRYFTC